MSDSTTAATRHDASGAANVTTPEGSGSWVPMTLAAELQGVSLRTLQRRAAGGGVITRTALDGRREVWVTRHARGDATANDTHQKPAQHVSSGGSGVTGGGDSDATAGAIVRTVQAAVVLAERRAEELAGERDRLRLELTTTRRTMGRAWATAAALGVLVGVAGVGGVRAIGVAEGRAAAAVASQAIQADLVAELRHRAERAEQAQAELAYRHYARTRLEDTAEAERPIMTTGTEYVTIP